MALHDSNPWSSRPWPELDEAALYGLTGEVVRMLAPHTEADPAALALDFLCGIGVMAGSEGGPWPHATADGAQHPGRLNVLIVGDTSRARKSSAFHQIRRILRAANPDFIGNRVHSGFGSGEALIDDVAESPDKRLWLVEHEFSRVLTSARREGSILSHVIRQAWDGDRLEVRTRKKKVAADDAHVAVLGHITREELQANLGDTGTANGFMNRILICCARRSQLLPSGGTLKETEIRTIARRINKILVKTQLITEMSRSEQAERLWRKYYREMAHDNPGGTVGAVTARSEAQVLRLSVVYALTDGSAVIKVQHLRAAWAMWRYCRDSATYVFGRGMLAETILAGLSAAGSGWLTKTDIHNLCDRHAKATDIDGVLETLEREGLIRIEVKESRGGRPQTRVTLKQAKVVD